MWCQRYSTTTNSGRTVVYNSRGTAVVKHEKWVGGCANSSMFAVIRSRDSRCVSSDGMGLIVRYEKIKLRYHNGLTPRFRYCM